ncbi:MAG TPA: prepilin-type N-terminal cleavage/methylation domain-containing protein [Gemmatimonadaceae bacterium]|nr:prepilin-type N-terminal cleavage/methylation domain-containing protein [Gemmatimonadaceae bacterium]
MNMRRPGFTLLELLIVLVIVGVLTTISLPKFSDWRARGQITSARQSVAAAIATARAAAVQKGYPGYFIVNGDVISVEVDTLPGAPLLKLNVVPSVALDTEYATELTLPDGAASTIIRFDPRGFASPRLQPPAGEAVYIIRLTSGARRDSVCVARMGQILPRGCSL